jgi:hypothetical protein
VAKKGKRQASSARTMVHSAILGAKLLIFFDFGKGFQKKLCFGDATKGYLEDRPVYIGKRENNPHL